MGQKRGRRGSILSYPVLIAKQLKEDGEEVVVLECGEGAQNDELLLGPRESHIHPPPVAQELAHLRHGVTVLAPPRRQSQEKEKEWREYLLLRVGANQGHDDAVLVPALVLVDSVDLCGVSSHVVDLSPEQARVE